MTQDYTLPNGSRHTTFTGELLGHATSRAAHGVDKDALRWTEIDIYRSVGGNYIVHQVGRSRVYHEAEFCNMGAVAANLDAYSTQEPDRYDDLAPCPKCWEETELDQLDLAYLEQDRSTVTVSETAEGAIQALTQKDRHGIRFHTKTAVLALDEAAERDESLFSAWTKELVA